MSKGPFKYQNYYDVQSSRTHYTTYTFQIDCIRTHFNKRITHLKFFLLVRIHKICVLMHNYFEFFVRVS